MSTIKEYADRIDAVLNQATCSFYQIREITREMQAEQEPELDYEKVRHAYALRELLKKEQEQHAKFMSIITPLTYGTADLFADNEGRPLQADMEKEATPAAGWCSLSQTECVESIIKRLDALENNTEYRPVITPPGDSYRIRCEVLSMMHQIERALADHINHNARSPLAQAVKAKNDKKPAGAFTDAQIKEIGDRLADRLKVLEVGDNLASAIRDLLTDE